MEKKKKISMDKLLKIEIGTRDKIKVNFTLIASLAQLLIDKGITTQEEIDSEVECMKRHIEEMINKGVDKHGRRKRR